MDKADLGALILKSWTHIKENQARLQDRLPAGWALAFGNLPEESGETMDFSMGSVRLLSVGVVTDGDPFVEFQVPKPLLSRETAILHMLEGAIVPIAREAQTTFGVLPEKPF